MKTIKNTQTGELQRVGDKEADAKVKLGWNYCSKEEWKKVYSRKSNVTSEEDSKKSNNGKKGKRKVVS